MSGSSLRRAVISWALALALGVSTSAVAAAAPAAAPRKVAVMPLGSAVLLPSVRDALDADLRAAVAGVPGVKVQPAEETQAHITEAGESGLDLVHCPPSREDCALRVGVLADVDYVVTFVVEEVGDRLLLRGGWIATDGAERRHIAGELYTKDKDPLGQKLRALVTRVVTGAGEPSDLPFALSVEPVESRILVDGAPRSLSKDRLWLLPGPHVLHIEAPDRAPLERMIQVSPDGEGNELTLALAEADTPVPFYVGVGVAATGGLLALGGATVYGVDELLLERGQVSNKDRPIAFLAGYAAAGAGLTGVLLVGGGAVIAAVNR